MRIFKIISVFILLLSSINTHAQIFGWVDDGYWPGSGGGSYSNIDNSGITLNVNGLVNDDSAGNNSLRTGINDQNGGALIHTYNFTFSEAVDVEFEIDNINTDSISECFNDLLVFTNSPLITGYNPPGILIYTLDSVIPLSSEAGKIDIKYSNVTNFSFTHGNGEYCNPGYIDISKLRINGNILNISDLNFGSKVVLHNSLENEIIVDCYNCTEVDFEIFDALGRKHSPPYNLDSGKLIISTEKLNAGNYFIRVVLDKNDILQSRFFKP